MRLLNSWSHTDLPVFVGCLHAWKEKHPQFKARRDGGDGDIIDWAMDEMAAAEGWGDDWPEMEVEVAWGHFVIIARRK